MATRISDIAQANAYTGNAALGGGTLGVVELNTRPVDALAHYTFLYKQREHDENEKRLDAQIKQFGELAQFNPNLAIPKDKDEAIAAYNEMMQFARDYAAEEITHENRAQKELEFQQRVARSVQKVQGANSRAIAYQKRKDDINTDATMNPAQKERMLRELEDEANRTTIDQPISATMKFDYTVPTVGKAPMSEIDVAMIGGDDNAVATYTMINPRQLRAAAAAQAMDMRDAVVDPNSPEYQRLSPTARLHQDMLRSGKGKQWGAWREAGNFFNQALQDPRYRTQDGKLDENYIKSANPLVGNILSLVDNYNEWVKKKKAEAQQGVFTDRLGRQFRTATPINPDDFVTIDKSKGLTPEQLLEVQMWANADADKKEVKLTHTGEASQNARSAQQEAGANYRARLAASNRTSSSGSGSGTGAEQQVSGNAFDEIGGTGRITFADGNYMEDGFFYGKDGKPKKGHAVIGRDQLPASVVSALEAAKITIPEEKIVLATNENGEVVHLQGQDGEGPDKTFGTRITRSTMENAQKKFDTERKGQEPLLFGRRINPTQKATGNATVNNSDPLGLGL